MSYNVDVNYIEDIKQLLQNYGIWNYEIQTKFMDVERYNHLVASSSLLIFAHNRQQGLGNLELAASNNVIVVIRKKIILNKQSISNPSWGFLESLGVKPFDYNNLKEHKCLSEVVSAGKNNSNNYKKKSTETIFRELDDALVKSVSIAIDN